ncbi:MAG: hypothetical protein ABJP02_04880 [Parasphingorhabdus sp.]|uniref:hypothetical protein n=1 Tax=Parasphingorhabdus sp. TaxID=2709688 RepID=UPI003297C7DF
MKQKEKTAAIVVGEGAMAFKKLSAEEANKTLSEATGCSVSECLSIIGQNGQKGLVATVAIALCENADKLAMPEMARLIDANAHSKVMAQLRSLIPAPSNEGENVNDSDV